MNEKRAKRVTLPRPEVPNGFPNDPRPNGVYFETDPFLGTGEIVEQVVVREGSIIRREPARADTRQWWLNS